MRFRRFVFFVFLSSFVLSMAEPPSAAYQTHKVVKGESFYQIGKRYGVSVDDLLKVNPGVTPSSLKPGMLLRVPVKPGTAPVKPPPASQPENKPLKHTVKPKETLYGIAKQYGVTIDQLKTWNKLGNSSIQPGMVLQVAPPVTPKQPEAEKPVIQTAEPEKPAANKPEVPIREDLPSDLSPEENLSQSSLSKKYLAQQKTGAVQVLKGTADLMASSDPGTATTYFALHKSAPVGTILKLKNLENGKVTYAKVIGKLPETDENKYVAVRVSQGVSKALLMGYGKAYVEMTYAQ